MRNLVDERAEAVEQLLLLCQSYAPDLFNDAKKVAGDHRQKERATSEVFEEMRGIYGRVVETLTETARSNLVHGAFDEALNACDGFTYGLARRDLRNEILQQKGRWSDLRKKQRQGMETEDGPRNVLRQDIFDTIDAIVEAAALPTSPPSLVAQVEPLDPQVEEGAARPEDVTSREHTGDSAELPARSWSTIIGADSDVVMTCKNLEKRYKESKVDALAGVSLNIMRGRILGVVGLNGSGKSTLLTIIAGDLAQSAGTADRRGLQRSDIALVPQKSEPWTGQLADHLSLHAAYYGRTGAENDHFVDETLTQLDLQSFRAQRYAQLSAGTQTRCALARAVVSAPKLLILDEPLASLDPVAQYMFLANLYAYTRHTLRLLPVIVSSQHVDAVETFADEMLVMRDGRPIFCGPTADLGAQREENVFEIRSSLSEPALRLALQALKPRAILPRAEGQAASIGGRYELRMPINVGMREVLRALRARGAEPSYFSDLSRSSLALLLKTEPR